MASVAPEPRPNDAALSERPPFYKRPIIWLRTLSDVFGFRFMLMLFVVQHLLKGFMAGGGLSGLTGLPIQFLYNEVTDQPPLTAVQRQIYFSVVASPWSAKSLFGIMSDVLPIFGYRKLSYMWITLIGGAASCVVLAVFWPLSAQLATTLLFFVMLNSSMCDLLSEAKYAEKLKKHPTHGPDLMSFVWGGIFVAKFASVLLSGPVIEYLGPNWAYVVSLGPLVAVMPVLYFNLMGEERTHAGCLKPDMRVIRGEKNMLILSVILFVAVMVMNALSLTETSVSILVSVALGLAVVLLLSFYWLVPHIFKIACFLFLQRMFTISIEGATFLFFTDPPEAYPEGPHFSKIFYTTGVGTVGAVCSLVGIALYNKFMHKWKYRTIYLVNNIIFMAVNLLNVVIYLRWNLAIGIPDTVFMLGSDAFQEMVAQWTWIPSIVLLSQLCPDGVEATMYAVLAGGQNLTAVLGAYVGAYILELLGVRPTGLPGDSPQFENLWVAGLLAAVLPCVPLALLRLVPDAYQTDRILPASTTDENDESHYAPLASDPESVGMGLRQSTNPT